MPDWYIHLPSFIDPVAFSIGSFGVRWYGLMYVFGFFVVWGLLVFRVKRKETKLSLDVLWDIAVVVFLGALVGGRVGSVVLYGGGVAESLHFFEKMLSPFGAGTGGWTGWQGMSFFGALAGAMLVGWGATQWKKVSFWKVADFLAPAIPLGYMFGRIGNFLNGELWGRETGSFLAMRADGVMRHPSQLYEAFLEGLLLFVILWGLRNKKFFPGAILLFLGMGYALARFVCEFFRQEDIFVWGMTQGQLYAIILFVSSLAFFFWRRRESVIK